MNSVSSISIAIRFLALLLIFGFSGGSSAEPPDEPRHAFDPSAPSPVSDSLGVLQSGSSYFPMMDYAAPGGVDFTGITGAVATYLRAPVQSRSLWSNSIAENPMFYALRRALLSGDDLVSVQALAVLVRSRTSAFAEEQYRVYLWLATGELRRTASQLLCVLDKEFSRESLRAGLESARDRAWPPEDAVLWLLRVAGATGNVEYLPFLREAARGVEDLQATAVDALASSGAHEALGVLSDVVRDERSVAGWRAARLLSERAPEYLRRLIVQRDVGISARLSILANLASIGDGRAVERLGAMMSSLDLASRVVAIRSIRMSCAWPDGREATKRLVTGLPEGDLRSEMEVFLGQR